MDLATFRASRRTILNLVCGLTVEVKRLTVEDLATTRNAVPVPLHAQVQALIENRGLSVDVAALPDTADMINLVVKAAVIAPPITDEPSDTTLGVAEIPFADRLTIFTWAQQGVAPLASFPGESG